jgi:hypothetical protein
MTTSATRTLLVSIAAVLALSGCAATRYDGPGTLQEFAAARYQCVQETKRPVFSAEISKTDAIRAIAGFKATAKEIPSCSAFNSCLAAKGYFVSEQGRLSSEGLYVECN